MPISNANISEIRTHKSCKKNTPILVMAAEKETRLGGFETLFNKSVPHILEKIFFTLDYDSFLACRTVCKTLNDLLSSEPYQRRSKEMLEEKKKNEERLCRFAFNGNEEEVRNLISIGVNPNCREAEGYRWTPLYNAAIHSRTNITKLLLDAGADPNMASTDGETPLMMVACNGSTDLVKLLLSAGADPNKANNDGITPLEVAVSRELNDIVTILLEAGADPNKANNWGETPLHIAALKGLNYFVRLLLEAGAEPNKANESRMTPLQLALEKTFRHGYYNEVIKLLQDAQKNR